MTNMQTAQLIPVSQWVYNLYKVTYFTGVTEPGRPIKTIHLAASSEGHLHSDVEEYAPRDECQYTWELVKENVGHPRVIGGIRGLTVHEDGLCHGRRLAGEM